MLIKPEKKCNKIWLINNNNENGEKTVVLRVDVRLTNENVGCDGRVLRIIFEPFDEDQQYQIAKNKHHKHKLRNELKVDIQWPLEISEK